MRLPVLQGGALRGEENSAGGAPAEWRSEMDKKFYITTPIYYPSDNLHIGHAYCTVAALSLIHIFPRK